MLANVFDLRLIFYFIHYLCQHKWHCILILKIIINYLFIYFRFIFDFETLSRLKLDTMLTFGVELNIREYLEDYQIIEDNDPACEYEL